MITEIGWWDCMPRSLPPFTCLKGCYTL